MLDGLTPEGEQMFIFVWTITLTRNNYFKTKIKMLYTVQSLFAKRSTLFHIQIYFNITSKQTQMNIHYINLNK